jgi:AraC-like DNA-binding protein
VAQPLTLHPVAQPLILAAAAKDVERAIARSGTDPHRVFEFAGVDPARVSDPGLRLELVDYCRLIDTAARKTRDDFFGARFGSTFTPTNFSAVGTLVVNSRTVGDALSALARYYGWIQENSSLQFSVYPEGGLLEYQICDARIIHKHQDAELTLAAICGLLRHFLGPAWQPLETHFEHGRGGAQRDYQRVFGNCVSFDQPANAILVDARLLSRPMPRPDERAFAEVQSLISEQLAALDREAGGRADRESTIGLLTHVIQSQCRLGDVGIQTVAKRIGLTVNGLRRQLKGCDLCFDELVSAARHALAVRYLTNTDRDLTEIALMLGYSELSAFSRAFRRWSSTSPSAFRKIISALHEPRRAPY